MKKKKSAALQRRKPPLRLGISLADFKAYYWLMVDLVALARILEMPTHGSKPELSARIERRLQNLPDLPAPRPGRAARARDSAGPLRRDTQVVNYKSDAKTRAFFVAQIGPSFHFTYHLNQYRLAHEGVTYGDLVDEWLAESARRRAAGSQPPIAGHGKYNRFIRAFFVDAANQGKSLADAAAAWNAIKNDRGDPRYEPAPKRGIADRGGKR